MKRAFFIAALACGGLLLNSSAWSCIFAKPFRLEAIKDASTVFRGKVTNYVPRVGRSPATIEFEIVEMYRGDHYESLTLSWPNSTFRTPETWIWSRELIVAAGPNRSPGMAKEAFAVFQESCSRPFLLDDTPNTRSKVWDLIN